MEVIGVAADTAPSSGKGVRYGAFGGGGVTAMVVEVLLGVGGFNVDRGAEMTMFNTNIDVHPASPSFSILYHTNRHFRVLQNSTIFKVSHKTCTYFKIFNLMLKEQKRHLA